MSNPHSLHSSKESFQVRGFVKCLVRHYNFTFFVVSISPQKQTGGHPFSDVRYCLFSMFPATLHICWPPLHRYPRLGHTVLTRKHLVRLVIDSNYHRLVFLVPLTVFLKNSTLQTDFTSIINALLPLSIIDLVLILSLLLTSFWYSVSNWLLLTSSHEEI